MGCERQQLERDSKMVHGRMRDKQSRLKEHEKQLVRGDRQLPMADGRDCKREELQQRVE